MLQVKDVWVYGGAVAVLKEINLEVGPSEIVCVIGANGAGKSTLLKAISGLLPVHQGTISLEECDVTRIAPHRRARMGICQAPEGRQVFSTLSVMDNLTLGAHCRVGADKRSSVLKDIEQVFQIFPRLRERRNQLAGTLSGGEQQMLALARAFLGRPKIMLLDEPSLGLAPFLVKEIFGVIRDLSQRGVPILLVEQNARAALNVSDRGYVLETGRITLSGPSQDLLNDDRVNRAYLGARVAAAEATPEVEA